MQLKVIFAVLLATVCAENSYESSVALLATIDLIEKLQCDIGAKDVGFSWFDDFGADFSAEVIRNQKCYLKAYRPTYSGELVVMGGFSVVIFSSLVQLLQKFDYIHWQSYQYQQYLNIAYVNGLTLDLLRKDFQGKKDIAHRFDSVMFLVNEDHDAIELAMAFTFSPGFCCSYNFVVVNRYYKSTGRWENDTFMPKKYRNFHGCRITVLSSSDAAFDLLLFPTNINHFL